MHALNIVAPWEARRGQKLTLARGGTRVPREYAAVEDFSPSVWRIHSCRDLFRQYPSFITL